VLEEERLFWGPLAGVDERGIAMVRRVSWKSSRIGIGLMAIALAFLCSATSAHAAGRIYWGDETASAIEFANLDGSGGGSDLSTTGATAPVEPSGTTIDAATGTLYWVDQDTDTVSYASLNGSGGGTLNTTGASVDDPEGIAIDPATGMVYWANGAGSYPISFASLNGSGGGNLDVTGATTDGPSGLAIDPGTGKIYWANYSGDTISYANLDDSGGGGELDVSGATPDGPAGLAIDDVTGKIYWTNYNGDTISYANLIDTGGGGQLATSGVTLTSPWGLAIDDAAGRLYVANYKGTVLEYVDLNGSGDGGTVNVSPLTPEPSDFPALLEPPLVTAAPAINGASTSGSTLSCSQGSWAGDLLGAYLYRAPQSFAYSWSLNGSPIAGATLSSITASAVGRYVCQVTASNAGGATAQSSAAFTVAAPTPVPVPVPLPATVTTAASIDNQRITLTTPTACTASTGKLTATADSSTIAGSKATKLKLSSVAFYLDKGVKHTAHRTEHKHGHTKKVKVITYRANATGHHVPTTVKLSLAGLKPGTHTLKITISYKETVRKHGHRKTLTVTKSLQTKFTVC
jgi:hypothetical protein